MAEGNDRAVLLVSDDAHLEAELSFSLPPDTELRAARDARSAWVTIGERIPDVVCVEIRSGNAGGVALARDMAQRSDLSDIPIVMLLEREQDKWLARQAGATVALIQPVPPAEVMRNINALLVDPPETRSA